MKIHSLQSFSGKNIYSHRPVIKMVLDLGDLYKSPTCEMPDFNRRLTDYFPGIKKHFCSLGYEGGFAERLNEGTYIGHVTEHLILELQKLMGYKVAYGKTRVILEPSLYYIVFEYANERCGRECARAGVEIIEAIANGREIDIGPVLKELQRISVDTDFGPSTRAIVEEAKSRGIPCTRLGSEGVVQLGYGKYAKRMEASLSDAPSCIAVDIAGNKQLTKQILEDYKIPVPHGEIAYTEEMAVKLAEEMGYPVVVKPLDANQGKGVSLDLGNGQQVRTACAAALKFSKSVLVERFIKGKDYRILVVGDHVASVCERRPPMIRGDGIHTVRELVAQENQNPLRGDDHEKPLTKIRLDAEAQLVLSRTGLNEDAVPEKGVWVKLRENGNLSTGGTARECSGEIHPYNALLAVKAAKIIGLDIAGIDMVTDDITQPVLESNGAIIEVNAAPGLRMHLYPTEGSRVNVAKDIVEHLFPEGKPHSIPIVAITGTNGKTTTTRLIKHVLSITGKKVGMTSTSGIFIGNECVLKGDNTGPASARLVLADHSVEAAVLETARGGIVRKGLGYEEADVGVVVNISDDHLGLDGLNSLEDLAFVKALVIEAVKPQGYAVLNADDALTKYFMGRTKSQIMLFSTDSGNPLIKEHLAGNGKAVLAEDNRIYLCQGTNKKALISLGDIPITFGGRVECNIENALAAVSSLYALQIPVEQIILGLKSFRPDAMSNPGRFNLFDLGDFTVMLDYGHNPAGYNAVIKFVQKMEAARAVGVIGVPGDRLNRTIAEVGKMCGEVFSKIYIKEDNDLRGREPGEVAGILYEGAIQGGMKKENIDIVYSELKALENAILAAQPGDLIVMLYEEFEPAMELVQKFMAELEKDAEESQLLEEEPVG